MANRGHPTGISRVALALPYVARFGQLLLLPLFLTLFALVLTYFGSTWPIDRLLYDIQLQLRRLPAPDDLVIVEIDDRSLKELGRWPWSRAVHARLLERLSAADTQIVALDILFAEPDHIYPRDDQTLADAIGKHGKVVLPIAIEALQADQQLIEVLPFPTLAVAAAALGHVHVEQGPDGIARAVYLRQGIGSPFWSSISVEMLKLVQPDAVRTLPGLVNPEPSSDSLSPFIIQRDYYSLIPFGGPPGRFTGYSYVDVLNGTIPPSVLRDKIVFVGITAIGLGDTLPTPVSGSSHPMPGVEILATIFDGLRAGHMIVPLSSGWHMTLTALLVFAPTVVLFRVAPHTALLLISTAILGVLALSTLLLHSAAIWFPPSAAAIALLSAYPLWSWRRLAFTVSFLQQSLNRLRQEPVLEHQLPSRIHIDQMLMFWQQLLPLAGWVVQSASGAVIDKHGEQHRLNPAKESWTRLDIGDEVINIGLFWRSDATPSQQQTLLTQLQNYRKTDDGTQKIALDPLEARSLEVEEATDRLRLMRRFIGDCLAQMSDGVLVGDGAGYILVSNQKMRAIMPALRDEQPNRYAVLPLLETLTIAGQTTWRQLLQTVLVTGHSAAAEARGPGGQELWVELAPLDLLDFVGPGFIINASDISQLKIEARQREETLHFLSHDLRSPMVSLLALVDLARSKPEQVNFADFLQRIQRYATKNLELAEQFLQLARVENSTDIQFYPLNLSEIAENAVDQVADQAREKQTALRIEDNQDADAWVNGNAELLERAIVNLLTNAIKYSPPHKTVRIHIRASAAEVSCCVEDNGYGISQALMPKLFERFSRLHYEDGKGERGAGLGLRFVKSVAERHNGKVSVDSTEGRGSTFCITLPRDDQD